MLAVDSHDELPLWSTRRQTWAGVASFSEIKGKGYAHERATRSGISFNSGTIRRVFALLSGNHQPFSYMAMHFSAIFDRLICSGLLESRY